MDDRASRRQRVRQLQAALVATTTPAESAPLTTKDDRRSFVMTAIQADPTLLWERLAAGSTLMHWAAQHLKADHVRSGAAPHGDETLWTWLLAQAADVHRESLTQRKDSSGESVLDCFMTAWQQQQNSTQTQSSRQGPYHFGEAVQALRRQPHLLAQLRALLAQQQQQQQQQTVTTAKPVGRAGDRRVTLVAQVWRAWQGLCRAAMRPSDPSLLAFLARTGRALESFAWLAVTLHEDETTTTSHGMRLLSTPVVVSPLHVWASSPAPPQEDWDALGPLLAKAFAAALTQEDAHGALPLHRALRGATKPLQQVVVLARAAPATLGRPDPVSTLYPFQMAAAASRTERRRLLRVTERRHPSQALNDWLDVSRRDSVAYEREVNRLLLGSIYQLVRAVPQAVQYSRGLASVDDDDERDNVVTAAGVNIQNTSVETTKDCRNTCASAPHPVPLCGDVALPEAAKAYAQVLGQLIP
jgi:hypothetical protein